MSLTREQKEIVDEAVRLYQYGKEGSVLMVSAVAGAGKTKVLTDIADAVAPAGSGKYGRYLAYNKDIATEASGKFSDAITCTTVHSMAFRSVIVPNKYEVQGYVDHRKALRGRREDKIVAVDGFKSFCLSQYTSLTAFFENTDKIFSETQMDMVKEILVSMRDKKIPATHDFYLKMFHILLEAGKITPEKLDVLMLDESGDVNGVILQIFKNYPSVLKVAVGDSKQNIYQFNETINGFEEMKNEAKIMEMTKSFRVSSDIAERIEKFCNIAIDKKMKFKGMEGIEKERGTEAYITRTNSGLIGKMITLNRTRTPYIITRDPDKIFEIPIMLLNNLSTSNPITLKEYAHINSDVAHYEENKNEHFMKEYKSCFAYIRAIHAEEDQALKTAFRLISEHSPSELLNAKKEAKKHLQNKESFKNKGYSPIVLMTAHSSKGLEMDTVTIGNDLNEAVEKELDELFEKGELPFQSDEIKSSNSPELLLGYVAVSRAKHYLKNARFLDHIGPKS